MTRLAEEPSAWSRANGLDDPSHALRRMHASDADDDGQTATFSGKPFDGHAQIADDDRLMVRGDHRRGVVGQLRVHAFGHDGVTWRAGRDIDPGQSP